MQRAGAVVVATSPSVRFEKQTSPSSRKVSCSSFCLAVCVNLASPDDCMSTKRLVNWTGESAPFAIWVDDSCALNWFFGLKSCAEQQYWGAVCSITAMPSVCGCASCFSSRLLSLRETPALNWWTEYSDKEVMPP